MYRLNEKNREIGGMFDAIAPRYDFLNRVLSLGIDRGWRKKAVDAMVPAVGGRHLDLATGTADVMLTIFRRKGRTARVVGADISVGMMRIGKSKACRKRVLDRASFVAAPGESLPFADASFDSCVVSFGIRNVVDRGMALREMARVTKPGGRVVVLEFSTPKGAFFGPLYRFYFTRILPKVAALFSRRAAYEYLPDSVASFPSPDEFSAMMRDTGCSSVVTTPLTFGVATLYVGSR